MGALRYALAGLLGVAAACALFTAVAIQFPELGTSWTCRPRIIHGPPRESVVGVSSAPMWHGPGCRGFPIRCRFPAPIEPWRFEHSTFSTPEVAEFSSFSFVPEPSLRAGVDGERCGEVIASREMPEWPAAAERSAVKGGSVLIALDISERGVPKRVRVLESEAGRAFESAALHAVARWRYCPEIRDGRPISRENVRVRLRFERET